MSVTVDAPDAVTAAKARLRRENARNGAAGRYKNPEAIAARKGDLTTAKIACGITKAVVHWPHYRCRSASNLSICCCHPTAKPSRKS